MKYKLLRFSLLSILAMLWGTVFAQDPEVTLDFTAQNGVWNIPTSGTNNDLASFTDGANSIKLYSTTNYKLNNGYLILGKKNSYLELPAFNFDVEKIEIVGTSNASEVVKQNIYVGDDAVSTETTGAKNVTNTYEIASDYQTAGNIYKIMVTSNHNTQISKIHIYKKSAQDNLLTTTVTLSDYTTTGVEGTTMNLPSYTVTNSEGATLNTTVTWTSSKEDVATISGSTINLLTAGTTTIKASYEGDNANKPSSASYELTVSKAYSSIASMLQDVTATKVNVVYEFQNLLVTYVNGKYNYVNDGTNDFLLFGTGLGLTAGDNISGTAAGQLYSYSGLPELAVNNASDLTTTVNSSGNAVLATTITPNALQNNINKYVTINNAVLVSADGRNLKFTVGDAEFAVYNQWNIDVTTLEAGKAYTLTGVGAIYTKNETTTYQLYLDSFVEATATTPAGFQDFAVIVNNQDGTSLTSEEQVQGTDVSFGVAVEDGQTVRVAADDAKAIATISGKYHSEHGMTGLKVVTAVPGPVKILVGKCTYSTGTITVTNSNGDKVIEYTPQGEQGSGDLVCWKNDHSNVIELAYAGEATTLTITGMSYCPFVAVKEYVAPAEFQDFAAIVNNQDGTLLTSEEQVQGTAVSFGVAVDEEGNTVRVAADDAKAIATISGKYHSEHGMTGLKVVTAVPGPVKILVGKCTYSTGTITVTNSNGDKVIEYTPQGEQGSGDLVCWKNDHNNVIELVYAGEATTLTITGMSYCPFVAVQKTEGTPEEPNKDITATWNFAGNCANLDSKANGGAYTAATMASNVEGIEMAIEYNGGFIKNNDNSYQVSAGVEMRIPVKNAGDLVTVKGYSGYSHYTIGNSTEELNNENTYKAKISDAEAGYVAVTSTNGNNYYLAISVVQYAPKEKITLDNEMATITFPFNEGTEGQKATFSNADYFLSSKVTYGSNLTLKDKYTLTDAELSTETNKVYVDQTRFEPAGKLDKADEQSAVRFAFTPKPGFTFLPTKVSLNVTRYGTDNGLVDVTWEVAGGENIVLATGVRPNRNNSVPNISKLSYDIANATATEGPQSLLVHLYSLQDTKQFGVNDVIIEGILNGTEKDVPVLASFKVNGNVYAVEDVFGEQYEATLKLPKAEAMVSAENPLADVTATSGELGEITYEATETNCTVTIPMTAGETQMNYVLNVVFKPDYTLSYIDVDGSTVLKTQTVEEDATIGEFACDINTVNATKEGYKARGWFKTAVLGEKFTTADVITANTKLYAIQTEIEEASTYKKYNFDLANQFFYAEDHEAFCPAGDGFYWHDKQHGWAFKPGNTIDLLVGPKATVTVTLCQYGYATGIVVKKGDETLATLPGMSDGDGGTAVFNYEGEAGTITLELQGTGEMYIHGVKIVNTAEVNFESQGNWYFVKAGDAGSLIEVLDVVNGKNAAKDAERSFIFLPDGTYDLDATVKTAITGHNISIIGQSMDKTIIVTKPDKSVEGLGSADLFDNSGTNLYMQDLTLQNALDYYNAGSAGRAAVLQDAGNRTIGKNVRMLSYQDTYYSSNSSQQAYWETCDIHGTVDFICGGGDIRFQMTTISLEPRKADGTGSRTITAPTTNTQFGYVFDYCKIVDLAKGKGEWNFGRTWQNEPICVFLNTTLDKNAENTLISTRWIPQGMNNKDPKVFGEWRTRDESGNDITPASNKLQSYTVTLETILTDEQAGGYGLPAMFTDWNPSELTTQVEAPNASYENGAVTFGLADNGMIGCALFKNGEFVGLSTDGTFNITIDPTTDALTIRAANRCGGLGPEAPVAGTVVNSVNTVKAAINDDVIYNLQGVRVSKMQRGLYIKNGKKVVVR